ncbi:MAG: YicC/YloC family endoribonuclease [Deltaproteobacteria bacterium]|nr:YicC/YloC family endoribonuclease [Deltaproteobacteria bacterium]
MIKSMTGYGKGEAEGDGRRFSVEIRSVNHRYCDISVRLPRRYASLEGEVKKAISGRISRGKLDVTIMAEEGEGTSATLEVNIPLADSYYSALCNLKERLGLAGDITVKELSSVPDIITFREEPLDVEKDWPFIRSAINKGMDALDEMRRAEGDALTSEVLGRLDRLSLAIDSIEERAPATVQLYKDRLAEKIGSLGYELDQGRLAQEVAYFADRCDISEELVRLKSHLEQFRIISRSPEPAGRKLDFLLQEINREVNTIGSKGNDALISQKVIEVKAELEKIREQVQNIE